MTNHIVSDCRLMDDELKLWLYPSSPWHHKFMEATVRSRNARTLQMNGFLVNDFPKLRIHINTVVISL